MAFQSSLHMLASIAGAIDSSRYIHTIFKPTNVYVLELVGGKYYVGTTSNIGIRYQQHIDCQGSAWTRKYPPINLLKIYQNASPFDEDRITKEYMAVYGIDAVRGGSYVKIQLSSDTKQNIQREIQGAFALCLRCGSPGHFIRNCPDGQK